MPVLVVGISELDPSHKPCFITDRGIQGGSYKRVDDADVPLSANEIYSLMNAFTVSDADRRPVCGATKADLDARALSQTLAQAALLTPRALRGTTSQLEQLARLNIVSADGSATKAGLLCMGSYPQQYFPKLVIDVATHAGPTKSLANAPRFLDRRICEGTLGEMLDEAVLTVAKNLRRRSIVKGVGRIDELEIPEEIIREALANALIHREYDSRFDGEAIAVDLYPDRIEVTSPGGLWGKSRAALADGRSCCRNTTLMRLMSIAPMPGNAGSPAEGNGCGIPLMIEEATARGLEPPQFYPSIDHFKVVINRPPTGVFDRLARPIKNTPSIEDLLGTSGELSVRELQEMSGLTINQVRYRLKALIREGLVEATAPATSKNRAYRLAVPPHIAR